MHFHDLAEGFSLLGLLDLAYHIGAPLLVYLGIKRVHPCASIPGEADEIRDGTVYEVCDHLDAEVQLDGSLVCLSCGQFDGHPGWPVVGLHGGEG